MKIAVASTDGINVNEHFGRAEKFLIFEVTSVTFNLLEELQVEQYSQGDQNHSFDRERFTKVAAQLAGCSKLFVTKIGAAPAAELTKIGVDPVIYQGPISDIIL